MNGVSLGKLCLDAVATASPRTDTECRADVTRERHNRLLPEDQATADLIDELLAAGRTDEVIDFVFGPVLS